METPVYWTSSGVLIISLQCTEHPPMYCTGIMQADYAHTGQQVAVNVLITCYALFLKSDWFVALLFLLK